MFQKSAPMNLSNVIDTVCNTVKMGLFAGLSIALADGILFGETKSNFHSIGMFVAWVIFMIEFSNALEYLITKFSGDN